MLRFTDPLTAYTFTIQSYQWGYTDTVEYVTREYGTTEFGTTFREWTGDEIPQMTVRFAGTDDAIDQVQTMTMLAMRHGQPIRFYPDADVGTYQLVLWPSEVDLDRVLENRAEIELTLREAV